MSDELTRWQEDNEQYLAGALAWLRLRLAPLASESNRPLPVSNGQLETEELREVENLASGGWRSEAGGWSADEAEAASRMDKAAAIEPPPALLILAQRLGLSRFEQEILLLCAAMELDTRTAALCAAAQDDPQRPYPTFALALALLDEPAWDALSPERPLRYWRLIDINQPGAQPLTTSPLRADERIVSYLKGLNYLDDRLTPFLIPFEATIDRGGIGRARPLPPSQAAAAATVVRHLQQGRDANYHAPTTKPPVIQLVGPDGLSKQLLAQQAAAELDLYLYRLPVEMLPTQAAEVETLARLWQRESLLLPVALYLDAQEVDDSEAGTRSIVPLQHLLARSSGVFFLATRDVRSGLGPATAIVEVNKPTPAEQRAAWAELIDDRRPAAGTSPPQTTNHPLPALLASQFNLNLAAIQQIAQTVNNGWSEAKGPLNHDSGEEGLPLIVFLGPERNHSSSFIPHLWDSCLAHTRPRLDVLAQRLEPKATWEDIVLPDEEIRALRQVADQVWQRGRVYDEWGFRHKMNRGLGINALFAGESGTGKTMAAEVIANELRLNLYRIDLSAVVSKYIGETEKNLRRLFDAAEDGGAILFFDEADALFGKRSEVKDSHDRYANIEINYLLQRMEAYGGLAILATNMKNALDQAFMRRLRFIVNFPFPGPAERKAIWQKVFPPQTPVEGLDYDRLARFNLTGGSIHNIALNAAFLAAQAGTPVTMPVILTATRVELRKLERPINEAEFKR